MKFKKNKVICDRCLKYSADFEKSHKYHDVDSFLSESNRILGFPNAYLWEKDRGLVMDGHIWKGCIECQYVLEHMVLTGE